MRGKAPVLLMSVALVGLSLSTLEGCRCHDEDEYIWIFEEPEDDVGVGEDVGVIEEEEPEDPEDWDWAFPDPEIEPDPPEWEETRWEVEVIEGAIPRSFADNDRTSVIVDRAGTVWLGYHRCGDPSCLDPELVVGHRRAGQQNWVWEVIEGHRGLFGLEIIEADRPMVVYLQALSRELRVAMRQANGRWVIEPIPVEDADGADGFDVSRDRARFYVSHASRSRGNIEFFEYNTAAVVPFWRRLRPREGARSAAYERGLRGGNRLNFYLVHQDIESGYRLSEYDLGGDEWVRSSAQFPGALSSLLVRQNGEICTAGPASGFLRVTCGSFEEPLEREERLHGRSVYYLSSMIENRAQTLFVAYHDDLRKDLHVARKVEGQEWKTENVEAGETFGISTAVDHRDHLLMSYYYCESSICEVRLMERAR